MIGISLSSCINDILFGEVLEEDVDYIITSSVFNNEQELEDLITKNIEDGIWKKEFREPIRALLSRLEIRQPRRDKGNSYFPLLIRSCWVSSEDEIIWND
ncbi:hypothetical protein [Gloeothece verrucosa]|uniref:Uncharacterized protein n=1 Tax=Gloeothece verrucosa (strain PCC 7822) TaxID=497965 RepID=E0UNT8_GLOV7|nr:hypothetical protein [Gloeothece verrucosa]ADN18618.1 hypothetical protein Cyan7822_6981 [Gloeothece verrucosa PCC 7822]